MAMTMFSRSNQAVGLVKALCLMALITISSGFIYAFTGGKSVRKSFTSVSSSTSFECRAMFMMEGDEDEVFTFGDDLMEDEEDDENGDVVLFSSDWVDGIAPEKQSYEPMKRWENLSPRVKERIIKEQQAKAIRNKKKREPAQDKKRRMMMYFKKAQLKKKLQSRITRPLPLNSPDRKPLTEFEPNSILKSGTVISLTDFGAYIDVGTECDGLLHISQISREENTFVSHPRQVFSPGDTVENIYVHRVSPELKKLQLSMLSPDERGVSSIQNDDTKELDDDDDDDAERITLDEIAIDDELWGEIKRVTNFGAYVELGAEVDGFLHFMDHPFFGTDEYKGAPPSAYMKIGQRVRVWASNVDMDKCRIKLTALRPASLPILRRG